MSTVEKIGHYQRNLEKCCDNKERILHCISKLYKLPVTVQHLQETGVGRTVNSFRKYDGSVGDAARSLVCKWKTLVADEASSEEDDDEVHVPDVHESYTDNRGSPKLEDNDSLSNQSSESKHAQGHRENKSQSSTKHTTNLSKPKSEEKHERHEKSKHSSKHHSQGEKKSQELKSSKSNLKKEETCSSTKNNQKVDDSKKSSEKITSVNENDNRKRKENSSNSLKENKRIKLSDSKYSDEKPQLSTSEKNKSHSHSKSSGIQIDEKIKIKNEQSLTIDENKQNIKPKDLQEKSKSSSSKLKSEESSSKTKDNSEKQKHRKEENTSHKKHNTHKDSNHHSSKETSKSRVSSSSNKDHVKSSNRDKKKEHREDKTKHEKKKETKIRLMEEIKGDEGIDCNSGASFAEALGMCTMPQISKKRHNSSPNLNPSKSIKTEQMSPPINSKKVSPIKTEPEYADNSNPPSLLAPNVKLEPLNVDLASTLPEISPNYKPLPYINPILRKEEVKPIDDIIYVKNQRTKVYSGNKVGYTTVPTLYEMCIRVLIENIDALEFTGGVPYDILKPVLERATSDQLFMLEHYNPYLIEDTDILWQYHCNREFRSNERQEMESWREMYMRCLDEREAKLKTLTANIKQSIDKSVPVRSTKLAYVDNIVKPPRNILKKQAKYGTANATPATTSNVKKKLAGGGATNNATNIAVPPPPMSRFKASTSSVKKTKAPLMAKALQLIKGRYKR